VCGSGTTTAGGERTALGSASDAAGLTTPDWNPPLSCRLDGRPSVELDRDTVRGVKRRGAVALSDILNTRG